MASALTKQEAKLHTVADVKQLETATGEKHQLIDGRIYSMAGASEKHVAITGNINTLLNLHFRANKINCFPYASDLAVYYNDKNYYYPDIAVKCLDGDIKIIVEVLSKSTHPKPINLDDQTIKFQNYILACKGLQEYVLVEQDVMQVVVYRKEDDWTLGHTYREHSIVELKSIGFSTPIEEFYYWVIK